MKNKENDKAGTEGTKIFARLKKYLADRSSLNIKIADSEQQLQSNNQEIGVLFHDLDELKEGNKS